MKANLFKIECLTNLHVGSGEINYSIVDNEVEKDPVTGYPTIHASGIKGALREQFAEKLKDKVNVIFGMPGSDEEGKGGKGAGRYKFMDAHLLARPMRVAGSDRIASVPVVSVAAVNQYLALCNALGCNIHGVNKPIEAIDFGGHEFLVNFDGDISVEGDDTGKLSDAQKKELSFLTGLIGDKFAVAAHMDEYDLPVLARNCLVEGKENLWYEEIVPHGSVFWFVILTPDDEIEFALNFADKTFQFGAHASIGRGFCKVTCLKQA